MKHYSILLMAMTLAFVSSLQAALPVTENASTPHARAYQFSFVQGNLLANWSFEDGYYFWDVGVGSRVHRDSLVSRYGSLGAPISGSYAASVNTFNSSDAYVSDLIPVSPGEQYTLSLYTLGDVSGAAFPEIRFYSDARTLIDEQFGRNYTKQSVWALHSEVFESPSNARFARVVLFNGPVSSANGILYFDDVVFERGHLASSRASVGMSVAYFDGLGRVYQKQTLVNRHDFNPLIPSECLNHFAVYSNVLTRVGARAKIAGANVGGNDSIALDNDVTLPNSSGESVLIRAGGGVRLGDRDSVTGNIQYGHALTIGNQSRITGETSQTNSEVCEIPVNDVATGSVDIYVNNDAVDTLFPGSYGHAAFRARSAVYLSAGDYYFDTFEVEPQTVLHFDLSGGNVRIFVQSNLRIDDQATLDIPEHETNFVGWYSSQTNTLRIGAGSSVAGVFVLPNARLEYGSRDTLRVVLYAKEVYVMEDAAMVSPSKLFHNPEKVMAVSGSSYNNLGMAGRSELAFPAKMADEGLVDSTLSFAKQYYSAAGDGPDAGGYPYSKPLYSSQDQRMVEVSSPGADWQLGGGHTRAQDQMLVENLSIPATLSPEASVDSAPYVLAWSKDAQGALRLSWNNRLGQTVQMAVWVADTSMNLSTRIWAITRYEYTPAGNVRRTLTPLDNQGGDSAFASLATYDAQGRLIARQSPDRGLEMYYFAVDGSPRLSQSPGQRTRGAFSYVDYDAQGRRISMGETILGNLSEDSLWFIAQNSAPVPGTRKELTGTAYDRLSSCLDAVAIEGLSNWMDTLQLTHQRGRMACSWNRNPSAVSTLGALRALVLDVFSYDHRSRPARLYRYTGSISDSAQRLRSLAYSYDSLDRVASILYYNGTEILLARSDYHYDSKGRVASITGKDGFSVVAFTYDELGRVSGAKLGDSLHIAYTQHLHGQSAAITVTRLTTGDTLYREALGYESPVSGTLSLARYDGRIAQTLQKFAPGIVVDSFATRLATYAYDNQGRLKSREGTGLPFGMDYDLNGRITGQANGNNTLAYDYNEASYRLDHVNGTTSLAPERDMSAAGTFQWNTDGRLIHDASRSLSAEYRVDGMVTEYRRTDPEDTTRTLSQMQLYGPDGLRSATVSWRDSAETRRLTALRSDVNLGGRKRGEVWESYTYTLNGTEMDTTGNTLEYTLLQGRSSAVGRVRPDGQKEWYIKDHQGSLALSVLDGGYGTASAYQPYGMQTLLRADAQNAPSEQYTGKEWDPVYGFYYFGARFFDPVLAMWASPDPAGQYMNPYGFGGDPVNGVDREGRWLLSSLKIALGVYEAINLGSAIHAASSANSRWGGVKSFAIDMVTNSAADYSAPGVATLGTTWGTISSTAAAFRAVSGNGDWGSIYKPFAVAVWAPIRQDFNSLNNSAVSIKNGDFGVAISSLSESGTRSIATSAVSAEYSTNHGFGSQEYEYYGSYEDDQGYSALIWGQSTFSSGTTNALEMGGNVIMYKPYYSMSDEDKQRVFRHEMYHNYQELKYGLGGLVDKDLFEESYSAENAPAMFGYSEQTVRDAIKAYTDGSLNIIEIEAILRGGQPGVSNVGSSYTAPIFE
ncbi:MAG: hypothetical protein AUK31_04290 [Fibrobacteres bacterium CG2_30_45_31]|nr:MAG: hypothetical protein AUK31_04290 [Fibrobacteres bacterium CG2_30_45_31]